MKALNETVTMDDRVFYQSLYTTLNHALDDLMFFYSYNYRIFSYQIVSKAIG